MRYQYAALGAIFLGLVVVSVQMPVQVSTPTEASVVHTASMTAVARAPKERKFRSTRVRVKPKRKVSTRLRGPASTRCLPGSLKRALVRVQTKFGRIKVISTRAKRRIAGSGRWSKHARCQAVDFLAPRGKYRAVVKYLRKTHRGGVISYSGRHHHIHLEIGRRFYCHTTGSSCGRRYARKSRTRRHNVAVESQYR